MRSGTFTFVDLFAGIGGFHEALVREGGRPVFASEIDRAAARVYEDTYGMRPAGDIRAVTASAIPPHDVLTAGFPCQAFSKAGFQVGFKDRSRGTLFFDVLRIIEHHLPTHVLLENVRNIASHDGGTTWRVIRGGLAELGYELSAKPLVLSPHQLDDEVGAPQMRARVLMFATRNAPPFDPTSQLPGRVDDWSLKTWLPRVTSSKESLKAAGLRPVESSAAAMWGTFAAAIDDPLPGHPLWERYMRFRVSRSELADMPAWKRKFCLQNHLFYMANRRAVDTWRSLTRPEQFPESYRKFEWQAQDSIRDRPTDLRNLLWQFRPSGLRVKRATAVPALVAIGQVPVLGWENRRITTEEAAALQGFGAKLRLSHGTSQAYRQLGNAVHVGLIQEVFRCLQSETAAGPAQTALANVDMR